MTTSNNDYNREDFMAFFRDDEKLSTLSNDDRMEIFMSIIPGSSDFTKELFSNLFNDYAVDHLVIKDIADDFNKIDEK